MMMWYVSETSALTDPAEKYPNVSLYLQSPELVWDAPSWLVPYNLAYAPEDIGSWLEILPYERDRYAERYIVIPQLGIISPVLDIPAGSDDFQRMSDGQSIEINSYLHDGVIKYPGTPEPWRLGNMIIFGHSNFFKNKSGNYKTIFATLMRLDAWDEVWIYQRNGSSYDRFVYTITDSYPTRPSDTTALSYDWSSADITLITCYYGLTGRWIIQWTLAGKALDDIGYYPVLERLRRMPAEKRNYLIIQLVQRLDIQKEKNIYNAQRIQNIEDIESQLASYYQE